MKSSIFLYVFSLILFISLLLAQNIYAQDIVFSTEQSEYYFKIGENAIIPIQINNTYGIPISGILQYAITQEIKQANVQFSSSNSETKNLLIDEKEDQIIYLDLGTSDTPSNLILNLNFNYDENGERTTSIGPIVIHFVDDDSQKNNQQNRMKSSSSQSNTQPQQKNDLFSQQEDRMQQMVDDIFGNPQNLFSQQEERMQQRLNDLFGNLQNPSQFPQQNPQRNQLTEDNNALKQQIQNELQKQEQIQKEFENQLLSDNAILDKHQELLKSGYNVTDNILDAVSNNTGSFEIQYENNERKSAKLQGNMENGTITELKQEIEEEIEKLLEKLEKNKQFQQYHNQLLSEGFSQNAIDFQPNNNETSIKIQYNDQKEEEQAKIIANFENEEIKNIILEDNNTNQILDLILLISLIIIVIIILVIVIYFVIKKLSRKKIKMDKSYLILNKDTFEDISKPKMLMEQAQKYYNSGENKNAFGAAGKAIRVVVGNEIGIKEEITNEELIKILTSHQQNTNYPIESIKSSLKITDLVEFAKYNATEDDFKKITILFYDLLNKTKS